MRARTRHCVLPVRGFLANELGVLVLPASHFSSDLRSLFAAQPAQRACGFLFSAATKYN